MTQRMVAIEAIAARAVHAMAIGPFGSDLVVSDYAESGVPVIFVRNVRPNAINMEGCRFVTPAKAQRLAAHTVRAGDLVVTKMGLPPCVAAVYPQAAPNAIVTADIIKVTLDPAVAFAPYIAHFLNSPTARRAVERFTCGQTRPKVTLGDFRRLDVPVPPLSQQHRIAAILDEADALRRKRREALGLLDDLLRATFLEMFGDPVTNPRGWEAPVLGDVCAITTGNTPPRENPSLFGSYLEWIKSDNINTPSHYLTPAREYLSQQGVAVARTVEPGATLMTCIAGSPECIGNVAMTDRLVAFNQQINALAPGKRLVHEYLYAALLFGKKLVQGQSTESMKGMVSKGRLAAVRVPVPPTADQIVWQEYFVAHNLHAQVAYQQATVADALFSSLLHRAFTGTLG